MSTTFTKLFSSITESTIWTEPHATRIVWVTMMAMSDRRGRVWASIPGLANRARVEVSECKAAIERFLSPDEYSRTPDYEGRRIEIIDGGWRLLNHEKYRAIRDEESAKESKRKYINKRRAAERNGVDKDHLHASTVDRCRDIAEAESTLPSAPPTPNSERTQRARRVATASGSGLGGQPPAAAPKPHHPEDFDEDGNPVWPPIDSSPPKPMPKPHTPEELAKINATFEEMKLAIRSGPADG